MCGIDDLGCRFQIKPGALANLGKGLFTTAVGRPLHFKCIADNGRRIQITRARPGKDLLATLLPDRGQGIKRTWKIMPRLFPEFPDSRIQRRLILIELSFRYRPGADVLILPERPSRMDKKDFQLLT